GKDERMMYRPEGLEGKKKRVPEYELKAVPRERRAEIADVRSPERGAIGEQLDRASERAPHGHEQPKLSHEEEVKRFADGISSALEPHSEDLSPKFAKIEEIRKERSERTEQAN